MKALLSDKKKKKKKGEAGVHSVEWKSEKFWLELGPVFPSGEDNQSVKPPGWRHGASAARHS